MALILRIDVDRPYGKQPLLRHGLSRLGSDLYFPAIDSLGYLKELAVILRMLNKRRARSYVFFRRCTLPSDTILSLVADGGHEVGLHLENSRSADTFRAEKEALEEHVGRSVTAMSKHGSGDLKYGRHHYAPYEPERYVEWARSYGMKLFLGNLEDPTLEPCVDATGFRSFPSAYWLEPSWRDTEAFPIEWLVARASSTDVVMLIHPENVLEAPSLTAAFEHVLSALETRILQ